MKKLLLLLIVSLNATAQNCIPNTHSLSFNGISASADCITDNNLSISDSITVEAWIYANSWAFTSAQGTIVCKHSWSQQEQGYVLRAGANGQLSWNFAGVDTLGNPVSWIEVLSQPNALSLNTWYHVAGTFDGESSNIYINGQLAGSTAFNGSIIPGSAFPLKIGKLCDTGQFEERLWDGRIDEVRIWHRALSQQEIDSMKNEHIDSTSTGLAGYWRFNEGTGSTSYDLSSNGNNLNLSTQFTTQVPFNSVPATPTITQFGSLLSTYAIAPSYQWLLNNVPVPGATLSSYTPVQSGMYSVMVTSSSGCTATSPPVNFVVGIDDLSTETLFELIQSESSVMIKMLQPAFNHYYIYDISGRLVSDNSIQSNSFTIPTYRMAKGIYHLHFTGKSRASGKFMVK